MRNPGLRSETQATLSHDEKQFYFRQGKPIKKLFFLPIRNRRSFDNQFHENAPIWDDNLVRRSRSGTGRDGFPGR